eukprot:6002245-Amphidinium_carterae.2
MRKRHEKERAEISRKVARSRGIEREELEPCSLPMKTLGTAAALKDPWKPQLSMRYTQIEDCREERRNERSLWGKSGHARFFGIHTCKESVAHTF